MYIEFLKPILAVFAGWGGVVIIIISKMLTFHFCVLSGVWRRTRPTAPTWSTPSSCCSAASSTSATRCRQRAAPQLQVGARILHRKLCCCSFSTPPSASVLWQTSWMKTSSAWSWWSSASERLTCRRRITTACCCWVPPPPSSRSARTHLHVTVKFHARTIDQSSSLSSAPSRRRRCCTTSCPSSPSWEPMSCGWTTPTASRSSTRRCRWSSRPSSRSASSHCNLSSFDLSDSTNRFCQHSQPIHFNGVAQLAHTLKESLIMCNTSNRASNSNEAAMHHDSGNVLRSMGFLGSIAFFCCSTMCSHRESGGRHHIGSPVSRYCNTSMGSSKVRRLTFNICDNKRKSTSEFIALICGSHPHVT